MSQHKDEFIDVVSENFVNAYINEFNPKVVEWSDYFGFSGLGRTCVNNSKMRQRKRKR